MKTRAHMTFAAVAAITLIASPARAITFGRPDGDRHPSVGQMVIELPDGNKVGICTGTLVAPTVVLTASHCVAALVSLGIPLDQVWVSFDAVVDENATLHHGLAVINPLFGGPRADTHDVAVILLDEVVRGIAHAQLPTAGLLDELQADRTLRWQRFVTVGYGILRDDKTGGPRSLADTSERHYAEQSFQALEPYWMQLSMNPSTGSGGTCYGDSGGPHFVGETDVIAAITVTGDRFCRATDVVYRMDTDSARSFLEYFIDLP
jgi:secreted trypsin-like serine protease